MSIRQSLGGKTIGTAGLPRVGNVVVVLQSVRQSLEQQPQEYPLAKTYAATVAASQAPPNMSPHFKHPWILNKMI